MRLGDYLQFSETGVRMHKLSEGHGYTNKPPNKGSVNVHAHGRD